jgi:hypothetical protein
MASSALLRVDPGFTFDEATNRSLIAQEYLSHLPFGTVGFAFLQYLASSDRVLEAKTCCVRSTSRKSLIR